MSAPEELESIPVSLSAVLARLKTSAVAREGLYVLAAQGLTVLIALAADSPLFRILPEAERGTLTAALGLQAVLLILTDLGLALTTIRVGAQHFARGDVAAANFVFRRALGARVVLTVGVVLASVLGAGVLARWPLASSGDWSLVWAVAASLIGTALVAWGADVSQSRRRFGIYFAQQTAAAVLRAGALLAVLAAKGDAARAEWLVWSIAGASVLAGALSVILQRDALAASRPLSAAETGALKRQLFSFGRSASVMVVCNGIGAYVEVFILQDALTADKTAVFDGGRRLAQVLPLLTTALTTVLLPRAAALETLAQCRAYVRKTLRYALPFAVLASGGLALLAGLIVPWLWGGKYADSIPVLRWLCLAHAFALALNPLTVVLYPLQREGAVAIFSALNLALSVGFGLWLIPAFGPLGAAWSTLAVKALMSAFYAAILVHLLRHRQGNP